MSSDYNSISQFFSHPLVLLFIGAGISGVLIPYFTNRAANYQKGLEIKTDLVRQINERVMPIVVSFYVLLQELSTMTDLMVENKSNSGLYSTKKKIQEEKIHQKQKEVSAEDELIDKTIQEIEKFHAEAENEYKQWQVSCAVIESQINSYFPDFGQKKEEKLTWDAFSETVSRVFGYANEAYVAVLYSGPKDIKDWSERIEKLLVEKDLIVVQIQKSSVSGLSEGLLRRFVKKFTSRQESAKPDENIDHDSNQ